MNGFLIKGGLLVTPLEERHCDLLIEGTRVKSLLSGTQQDFQDLTVLDAGGAYLTPGLFDLQVNGGPECDFWQDLSLENIGNFSRRLLNAGVTSILPTLITAPLERLKRNRDFLKPLLGGGNDQHPQLVRMPGIHFEGPCISAQKPGVHPPEAIQPLSLSVLQQFVDESCKLVTLAPELDPTGDCIRFLRSMSIACSIGHSNASYEEAKRSFDQGLQVMTHTFNALPALHHRQAGAVAAALLDERVKCCMIPDGMHVNAAMLDLIVRLKGRAGSILVSDMARVGTSQGGLVGSSLLLSQGVRNMVDWGLCDFASAIAMASYNPAKLLQLEDTIGQIKAGAYADIVIWERRDLSIRHVIFNGELVSSRQSQKALI